MSQQQQSEQPPQQPQQPNWFVALIVTVIVSGIVQVLVNHFDAIAAFIVRLFSQVHLPPLQGSPVFIALNIISSILIIFSGIASIKSLSIIRERGRHRERHHQWMMEHLRLLKEGTQQMTEQAQQVTEGIQQLKEHNQQVKERNQQLVEQLAKQQRKKGKTV